MSLYRNGIHATYFKSPTLCNHTHVCAHLEFARARASRSWAWAWCSASTRCWAWCWASRSLPHAAARVHPSLRARLLARRSGVAAESSAEPSSPVEDARCLRRLRRYTQQHGSDRKRVHAHGRVGDGLGKLQVGPMPMGERAAASNGPRSDDPSQEW